MSHLLRRFTAASERLEDERKIGRIVLDAQGSEVQTIAKATLPGDNRRLRGIPVCARGVAGVSPHTQPGTGRLFR